jgi:hypothetical protein
VVIKNNFLFQFKVAVKSVYLLILTRLYLLIIDELVLLILVELVLLILKGIKVLLIVYLVKSLVNHF